MLKLGPRGGDSVEVCLVELVGDEFRSDYAERLAARGEAAAAETTGEGGAAAGGDAEEGEAPGAADKPGDKAATGSEENKNT